MSIKIFNNLALIDDRTKYLSINSSLKKDGINLSKRIISIPGVYFPEGQYDDFSVLIDFSKPGNPFILDNYSDEISCQPYSESYVGFRFRNVLIDKDEIINNAYIVLRSYNNWTDSEYIIVFGFVYSGDVPEVKTMDYAQTWLTQISVGGILDKTISPPSKGEKFYFLNVGPILQLIINHNDWSSGNSVGLFMIIANTTSKKSFTSVRCGDGGLSARLYVTFGENSGNTLYTFFDTR